MTFDEVAGLVPAEKLESVKAFFAEYLKGAMVRPKNREEAAKLIEGDSFLKAENDAGISRAVDSHDKKFKADTLPTMIEEELKKRNPAKDPREIEIEKMNAKLADMEKNNTLKEQKFRALAKIREANLPDNFVDRFIGMTDEETDKSLDGYIKTLTTYKEKIEGEVKKSLIGQSIPGSGKPPSTRESMKREVWNTLDTKAKAEAVKSMDIID
jgi:hypothetical protein